MKKPTRDLNDTTPITEEWVLSLGFEFVPGNEKTGDHDCFTMEEWDLEIWEFNGTGLWLWSDADHFSMKTRGHLNMLLSWVEACFKFEP